MLKIFSLYNNHVSLGGGGLLPCTKTLVEGEATPYEYKLDDLACRHSVKVSNHWEMYERRTIYKCHAS